MTHPYKHGKRIQQRRSGGQFRETTLQDFGIPASELATGERRCKACGCVWRPILVSGICPQCEAQDSEPVNSAE